MNNRTTYYRTAVYLALLLALMAGGLVHADKKLGQTGFQFLSVGSDAQAGALANAVTAIPMNSSSLFYNPASLSRMSGTVDIAISQNKWFADINHNAISAAFKPFNGRLGVIGFSFIAVDYGMVQGAVIWENEAGYILTDKLYPAAFSIGVGYARSLSDKFSVGGHLKYAGQQLGSSIIPDDDLFTVKKNLAYAYAIDFGTLYRTGFRSLVFGMSVRNFSQETEYEIESFQLPLLFTMGLAIDLMDLINNRGVNTLLLSVDALHPRSYPEQLKFGLEYGILNMLKLRMGYHLVSDEQKLAFGLGLEKFGIQFDYAYTPFGVFDNVQRISFRFAL